MTSPWPDISALTTGDVWAAAQANWHDPTTLTRGTDGVIHFTGPFLEMNFPDSYIWERYTGVQFTVTFPYAGPDLAVTYQNPTTSVSATLSVRHIEAAAQWGGPNGNTQNASIPDSMYLRFVRNRPLGFSEDLLFMQTSVDAVTWTTANATGVPADLDFGPYSLDIQFGGSVDLHDARGVTVTPTDVVPTNPDPDPPPFVVPTPGDPFDPSVTVPALDSGTSTLLDLVRAFSTAVKRAVRITGTTTIEMVDPAEPLPAGWDDADAAGLYVSASRSAAATAAALSVKAGDATLTATAQLVTDDVRILRSGWRIPGRLPMYEIDPGAVQRVTYTFSPAGFRASVDLHYPVVPIAAKGT